MRSWATLPGTRISGTDYDGALTDWCRMNLSFAKVRTNASTPPLPFRGGSFDLIYAISLFTHMTEESQHRWIGEVFHLLKPGGLFLFTVHGNHFTRHLSDDQKERYRQGDLIVIHPELNGQEACASFHPEAYVVERLIPSAGLTLVAQIERDLEAQRVGTPLELQTNYLARKPSGARN
jgi:SAM-dependent methyltransferase